MATVREVLVRVGFSFDDRPLKKANTGVDKLKNSVKSLGILLAGGLGARAFGNLVNLGSDVTETMNVLTESFQELTPEVVNWSRETGKAIGRSEFTLQKFASSFGSFLPQLVGSVEVGKEMSVTLAQLAVDLGSFFNIADDDALTKLRAGIVGETEPLRRLGIILTEASLNSFLLSQGINRTLKSMNEAEKVQVRFNFIMARTAKIQGDAERTNRDFANSLKTLKEQLFDLATRLSIKINPAMTKLVNNTRDMISAAGGLDDILKRFAPTLIGIGVLLTGIGIRMTLAFLPAIIIFAKFIGLATALGLVIEDINGFMKGQDSLIGALIEKYAGLGAANKVVEVLHRTWEDFVEILTRAVNIISSIGMAFTGDFSGIIAQAKIAGEAISAGLGLNQVAGGLTSAQVSGPTALSSALFGPATFQAFPGLGGANSTSNRNVTNNISINGGNLQEVEMTMRKVFKEELNTEMSFAADATTQVVE